MLNSTVKTTIVIAVLASALGSYVSSSNSRMAGLAGASSAQPFPAPTKDMGTAPTAISGLASLAGIASGGGPAVELRPDSGGQYHANVEIEGRTLPMLVDTGATLVALTYADADAIGYAPASSDYRTEVITANGHVMAAQIRLREVRVAGLLARDVPALVMPRQMTGISLLGMSFLKKLSGFEVASGNLVLRP